MSPLMSPLTSLLMSTSHHTLRTPSPRLSPQEALARALSLSSLSLERGLDQRLLWALTHPLTLKTALSEGLAGWLAHTLERERRLRPSSLPVSQRALDALNQASLQVMWADEVRREALCALWHRELPAPLLMKGASMGHALAPLRPYGGRESAPQATSTFCFHRSHTLNSPSLSSSHLCPSLRSRGRGSQASIRFYLKTCSSRCTSQSPPLIVGLK